MSTIYYRTGYRYQLAEDHTCYIDIRPNPAIHTPFIVLEVNGELTVHRGYAWDGPSGPVLHSKDSMRGSLVHDALYQLMREGYLPSGYRKAVDMAFEAILKEDGMGRVRAEMWHLAVSKFGEPYASPNANHPILEAP